MFCAEAIVTGISASFFTLIASPALVAPRPFTFVPAIDAVHGPLISAPAPAASTPAPARATSPAATAVNVRLITVLTSSTFDPTVVPPVAIASVERSGAVA